MIPRETIDEIRARCDIEEIIGHYVTLKRAGSNYSGLCPFHSEKSPSFTVFPATRSCHCFGCGAGGDVITFIKRVENLDYVEALEFLAARSEGRSDAMKSCTYTGIAYLITVVLLIAPYLIFGNAQYLLALACMLVVVILIIAGFTYYTSVAQGQPFKSRFLEMATISISVAVISFVVGVLAKKFLGVDV